VEEEQVQQQIRQPDGELITLGLTRPAMAALERAMRMTGDSRTDVVNLAVMGYAALIAAIQTYPPVKAGPAK
jgi:hypothetical protein